MCVNCVSVNPAIFLCNLPSSGSWLEIYSARYNGVYGHAVRFIVNIVFMFVLYNKYAPNYCVVYDSINLNF